MSDLSRVQLDSIALFLLDLHRYGHMVAEIFWALWLLPFSVLVLRSGLLPRLLGYWLTLNGLAYILLALTDLLVPMHYQGLFRLLLPTLLCEAAVMLWLHVLGVRDTRSDVDVHWPSQAD